MHRNMDRKTLYTQYVGYTCTCTCFGKRTCIQDNNKNARWETFINPHSSCKHSLQTVFILIQNASVNGVVMGCKKLRLANKPINKNVVDRKLKHYKVPCGMANACGWNLQPYMCAFAERCTCTYMELDRYSVILSTFFLQSFAWHFTEVLLCRSSSTVAQCLMVSSSQSRPQSSTRTCSY